MPPASLLQLCTAAAIRNVRFLNDIGNIPYPLARPFLLKIESPEKLRSLELQSPHLMKDDVELWLEFIKRDIPRWDEYELPEQPDCWYHVYCDLQEQVQRAVDEDAEKLKMALDGINSERAKHSAKFVTDRRSIGLPQERPTAKQRYASYDRKMGGIGPVFAPSKSGGFLPRSDTKKRNNIFTTKKRNAALAVPTKQLNNRATQVKQAPRSLIEEHRRSEPIVPRRTDAPTLRAPGRSSVHRTTDIKAQGISSANALLREREARLRALTSGHTSSSSAPSMGSSAPTPVPRSSLKTASSPTPKSLSNKYFESGDNTVLDEFKTSPAPTLRPAPIRKRPSPNVFIQPKKKKAS